MRKMKMHKQQYKGFTLYINDTHFGVEKLVEGVTTYERLRLEGCTEEEHIGALKLEIDIREAVDNLLPKGNPVKRDSYML